MAEVRFTQNLRRFLEVPDGEVRGGTVGEALDQVFSRNPRLRGYIVDDQGRLRKHVVIFLNGSMIEDRRDLSDPLEPNSELFVTQALSGG